MPRVVVDVKKKSFSTRTTIWFIFTHSLYFLFSTVQLAVTRWDEQEEKLFVEKKANGFFENSESLTRGKCCVLLPSKNIFQVLRVFYTKKHQTSVQNTLMFFSPLFCFFNGGSIFYRLEKNLRTTALLFSSHFPCPALLLLWKFSLHQKNISSYFLFCSLF